MDGIPNERLLGLLTTYTGVDSRSEAKIFLRDRLDAEGKLTVTEGPSSGYGEERTRTKDVKVANDEGKEEVSSARRAFEEAYFEFQGARDYIDKHRNSFDEGSQAKEIDESAWKAMGDTGALLQAQTFNGIHFSGAYGQTRLEIDEQLAERYKGYKTMESLLKDREGGEKTIAKEFIEALRSNLQEKQSNYEELKEKYGEDPYIFEVQEHNRQSRRDRIRDNTLDVLGGWLQNWKESTGTTPQALGITKAKAEEDIDALL